MSGMQKGLTAIMSLASAVFIAAGFYALYLIFIRKRGVPSWVKVVLVVSGALFLWPLALAIGLLWLVSSFLLSYFKTSLRDSPRKPHRYSGTRLTFKGKNYRVDSSGDIYEDSLFGGKVGKMGENGDFTIQEGIFQESRGRVSSWTGDVYEKDLFGGDRKKAGRRKEWYEG